jgi:hypothetical protein
MHGSPSQEALPSLTTYKDERASAHVESLSNGIAHGVQSKHVLAKAGQHTTLLCLNLVYGAGFETTEVPRIIEREPVLTTGAVDGKQLDKARTIGSLLS